MHKLAILLGCAALLFADAASAREHQYRFEFHFSKIGVDTVAFDRDQYQCLRDTSKVHRLGQLPAGPVGPYVYAQAVQPWLTSKPIPTAFYECMNGKGYRVDPNGQFTASFSTWL